MMSVVEVFGVSRFNLIERMRERPKKRIGREPLPDNKLVAEIKDHCRAANLRLPTCPRHPQRQALAAGVEAAQSQPFQPKGLPIGAQFLGLDRARVEAALERGQELARQYQQARPSLSARSCSWLGRSPSSTMPVGANKQRHTFRSKHRPWPPTGRSARAQPMREAHRDPA
jgi:hypothetical protein